MQVALRHLAHWTLLYHTRTIRIRRNFPYLTSVSFDMYGGDRTWRLGLGLIVTNTIDPKTF